MKDVEDYIPVNDEEELAVNQLVEEPLDLVGEQWKDQYLKKLMKTMMEENMVYFDWDKNSAADINILVELAQRQELMVVRDDKCW